MDFRKRAAQIVIDAGLCDDPGYYAGRAARRSDVNGEKLARIYREITSRYGKPAGQAFSAMVLDIPTLAATNFLQSLYQLETNDWHYTPRANTHHMKPQKPEDPINCEGQVFALFAAPARDFPDETDDIRSDYLARILETDKSSSHHDLSFAGKTRKWHQRRISSKQSGY